MYSTEPGSHAKQLAATTKADSGVVLIKEPPDPGQKALYPCSWWRRGRVELYPEHGLGVLIIATTIKAMDYSLATS